MPRKGAAPLARSNLRIATVCVLLLAFVALALGQWASARWLYGDSFDAAERRDALFHARHAQSIFANVQDRLERNAADNAAWDESYDYMLGRKPGHPDHLFGGESYRLLWLNGFAFVGLNGQQAFVRQYDRDQERFVPAGRDFVAALAPGGTLRRRFQQSGRTGGYARIGGEPYAWAAAPIVHSDGRGPAVGFVVMISKLDQRLLDFASAALDARVELEQVPGVPAPAAASAAASAAALQDRDIRILPLDDGLLATRLALGPLDGTLALAVKVTTPRTVHLTALRATRYLFWTTLVFGTLLSAIALWFIEQRLLNPLQAANARTAALLSAIPDRLFRMARSGLVTDARAAGPDGAAGARLDLAAEYSPAAAAQIALATQQSRQLQGVQLLEFAAAREGKPECAFEARVAVIDEQEALCVVRDVTQRRQAEAQIRQLAYFDVLTGLPNRQAFLERLGGEVGRARRNATRLAVLFVDLDGFKGINDSMGHHAGDLVLQWAADRLRQAMRPSDMVSRAGERADPAELALARLGGDEFIALMHDFGSPEDALVVAHRLRDLMQRPFVVDGREVVVTASIGIALYPEDGDDAATLLKHADTAMYHAKSKGRDDCQFYSAALTERAMQRMDLLGDLRQALERGELHLVYQPQWDLAAQKVLSVEALLRWRHPTRGIVAPGDFIALAEETGLIVPIGQWVLRQACADAVAWQRAGQGVHVAVNLSPTQFKDAHLLDLVRAALVESGLRAALLELEITEGAIMEDSEATLATLHALREVGVAIALDDFGTGYSSMSYLKRMPIDCLKVDRSFISGLPDGREDHAIVRAILSLAKSLGFVVTAEGVETVEQARVLCDLACDRMQGFLFSRPVEAACIPELLARSWPLPGGAPTNASPGSSRPAPAPADLTA